ncbi:MAG: 3-oxoacyl-[acyl-carrier-protein] reductase [Bacteriovoracaceae bacterium]|nr:3-oxoacyl-[acyl-carrier-protein] reductase [Bacteriovoracaceae bacterium]
MTATYSDLKDKVILVTGAARGIGKSIALTLAKQGAHVVFNYRGDEAKAAALQEELTMAGGKATGLKFDVTDYEAMTKAIDEFTKTVAPISGLVNNAGISKDTLLLRLKPDEMSQIIDTNLKGAMMVTQALSRNFLKAENVSIVNMSSIVGLMGNASQAAYAASKAGLIGFSKSVAKELATRNVRCNVVCPGFIQTDMTEALNEKAKEEYSKSIPLGRMGNAEEVAQLTCFLLSSASSYVTGEVIKIDGGLYI